MGNDTSCTSEIAVCPTGSCCIAGSCQDTLSSGGTTAYLNEGGCALYGTYLGDGTTCATANTTCRGACCSLYGCIDNIASADCERLGAAYLGNDITCASQLAACPSGACCISGSCQDIVESGDNTSAHLNQAGCTSFGGTYLGDASMCSTSGCTEACCFGASCEDLLPIECTARGGIHRGPASNCSNPILICGVVGP